VSPLEARAQNELGDADRNRAAYMLKDRWASLPLARGPT
jgi:hypothetical protein